MAGESSKSAKNKGKEIAGEKKEKKEKPKREKWYDEHGGMMEAMMTPESRASLSKIVDDPEFIKSFPGGERGRLLRAIDKRERIVVEKLFNEMWLEKEVARLKEEVARLKEALHKEQQLHFEAVTELHSLRLEILEEKVAADRAKRAQESSPPSPLP